MAVTLVYACIGDQPNGTKRQTELPLRCVLALRAKLLVEGGFLSATMASVLLISAQRFWQYC